ncbi:MAG: ATP synthase F1 subunit delta [Candidatus Saganbacteria bacterium]|nr:ATP synthase F1 subunit delta [Candidatus Saganbacteria bacterium]
MKKKDFQFDFERLYELTQTAEATLTVEEELYTIQKLFNRNFTVKTCLENLAFSSQQKEELCMALLPTDATTITKELVKLLAKNGRLDKIKKLSDGFSQYISKKQNIAFAEIETTLPLSPSLLEKAKQMLEKFTRQKVILKEKISPEIIGGFLIKIMGGKVLDATLQHKLWDLRTTMLKTGG